MANIVFEDVQKIYPDGTQAVFDLDMEIEDGEFVIFVGPSGCGKSTVLRMVAGLEDISGGKISIGDKVVNDLTPKERDIAMVFQSYALYPHMSVADNMGFALKLSKTPKAEIEKRVNEAAEILGLTEYLHRKPKALSGGQRQRVAMGRAIVRNPQAFLMDEPLSNLDAKLRVQMRAEIADLQSRLGTTTLYVTHDQVEAMTMGDRVAVLKAGRLEQVDAPQRLYDHPDTIFVAGFMGSPSMNIAEAELAADGDTIYVEIEGGGIRLRVAEEAIRQYPKVPDYVGQRVAIGMRPEHFTRGEDVNEDQRLSRREIGLVEMLGAEMLVHFKTGARPIVSEDIRAAIDDADAFEELERKAAEGGQDFVARFDADDPPTAGDVRDFGFETEHLHFFDPDTGAALR
jgi:multiple sugar transport system ATP-binding protein